MAHSPTNFRREQRNAQMKRHIASSFQQLSFDEPSILKLFVTRVELSKCGGTLNVYCSTYTDEADYLIGLETLKLYKPSMRSSLGTALRMRYVPDIKFKYDANKDKERGIEAILDSIKED